MSAHMLEQQLPDQDQPFVDPDVSAAYSDQQPAHTDEAISSSPVQDHKNVPELAAYSDGIPLSELRALKRALVIRDFDQKHAQERQRRILIQKCTTSISSLCALDRLVRAQDLSRRAYGDH